MAKPVRARVFMNGGIQHVIIPAEYQFAGDEVFVRRDLASGDLILSQSPRGWPEFFAAIDENRFPDDFLADRAQGTPKTREDL